MIPKLVYSRRRPHNLDKGLIAALDIAGVTAQSVCSEWQRGPREHQRIVTSVRGLALYKDVATALGCFGGWREDDPRFVGWPVIPIAGKRAANYEFQFREKTIVKVVPA